MSTTKDKNPCPDIREIISDLKDGEKVSVYCAIDGTSHMAKCSGNKIHIYDTSGWFKEKIATITK